MTSVVSVVLHGPTGVSAPIQKVRRREQVALAQRLRSVRLRPGERSWHLLDPGIEKQRLGLATDRDRPWRRSRTRTRGQQFRETCGDDHLAFVEASGASYPFPLAMRSRAF